VATVDPSDFSRRTVAELIQGGDWAGAEGYEGTLAIIARHLAMRVRPDQRREFHEIERLCATDMGAATVLWNAATRPVRARCGRPGPRRSDV
jgi:hypothetical protein